MAYHRHIDQKWMKLWLNWLLVLYQFQDLFNVREEHRAIPVVSVLIAHTDHDCCTVLSLVFQPLPFLKPIATKWLQGFWASWSIWKKSHKNEIKVQETVGMWHRFLDSVTDNL
jgi:hypothetical protein